MYLFGFWTDKLWVANNYGMGWCSHSLCSVFFLFSSQTVVSYFSSFSDKHPWMAKWGASFILEVIWLCFFDAHITLSSHGLAFLSFFLIFFLGFSSIGLFEIILKDWNFFKIATAVLTAWLLLYVIYVFLSVLTYWEMY